MVITKIWGWILIFSGLFFIVALPSIAGSGKYGGYMPEVFQNTIVLIGIIMLGAGIFLLVKT